MLRLEGSGDKNLLTQEIIVAYVLLFLLVMETLWLLVLCSVMSVCPACQFDILRIAIVQHLICILMVYANPVILKVFEYHPKMDIIFFRVLTGDVQVIDVIIGECQQT